ncbi:type II toxin-antitoxin system VapC family toxin [bacterium]|nr:type II toxin-antitoxin system VapC family toxin [bacterium]
MKLLLDTNVCIDLLRGRPEVVARFRDHSPSDLGVSAVTVFELIQGTRRAPEPYRAIEREKVETFLALITTVLFDGECGRLAGEINADLLNRGTPVGVMDVFIAATALRMEVSVVTNDSRDFSRIAGLEVIDWREEPAGGSTFSRPG